jgi:DNA-directed RNA polymerase specialized sigma24 family protein
VQPTNGNHPDRTQTGRARAFKTYVEPELEVLFRVARTLTGCPADAEGTLKGG